MAAATYTDDEVTGACNLHIDNLRRLITWGAVRPVQAGGGRGRVRKWTADQVLRISVTAQFVDAGFSLQMAHTLTHCIPQYHLVYTYDPERIRPYLERHEISSGSTALASRHAFGSQAPHWRPSRVVIIDRKLLYANDFDYWYSYYAAIDLELNRVYPTISPYEHLLEDKVQQEVFYSKPHPFRYSSREGQYDAILRNNPYLDIVRSSLLIDEEFLEIKSPEREDFFRKILTEGIPNDFYSFDDLICKNFVVIDLSLGLTVCVQKLLGLPLSYWPMEKEQHAG